MHNIHKNIHNIDGEKKNYYTVFVKYYKMAKIVSAYKNQKMELSRN